MNRNRSEKDENRSGMYGDGSGVDKDRSGRNGDRDRRHRGRGRRIALVLAMSLALAAAGCANKDNAGEVQPEKKGTGEEGTGNFDGKGEAAQKPEDVKGENKEGEGMEGEGKEEEGMEGENKGEEGTEGENKGEEDMEGEGTGKPDIVPMPEWPAAEIPENDALDFVRSMQLGWCLGNTFDAVNCNVSDELQYESAWCGAVTTKEMIQEIAAAGFRTIRIPVSWHNHVDEEYQISQAWMNRVQEVADWALEEDMYVIINIHHDNEVGFLYPSYEHLEQSKQYVSTIWGQIAARFADYDERLVFETMNEPRQTGTDHEWWVNANSDIGKECLDAVNQLNQAAVDAIRGNAAGYNATRYIMAPGYCASPDFALADGYVLPEDSGSTQNRILVSVHAYTPYNFALAGPTDTNSTDQFSVAEKNGTRDIDTFMKRLYDKFIAKGIGVVIGEFGARNKNDNLQARTEFAAYYVARARHYGMTACWWDNNAFVGSGENFGLFLRKRNQFAYPEILEQMVHYSGEE